MINDTSGGSTKHFIGKKQRAETTSSLWEKTAGSESIQVCDYGLCKIIIV